MNPHDPTTSSDFLSSLLTVLTEPFYYTFLRRAFVASWALSISSAPLGVILVLRRMSLMGDALSHSVLPGVALGFFLFGLSLPAMTIGGVIAGLVVAILAGAVSRWTSLREDASFAGFFLISLAIGVILISLKGSHIDLMHILFGSVLAVDDLSLLLIATTATLTLTLFAWIYRPLIIECIDPVFFRSVGGRGYIYHGIFLICVVANLVAAFQSMGTLMALGMMMLPAITARFWSNQVWSMIIIAWVIGALSSYIGLLTSYHFSYASGPAIVLVAGLFYVVSLVVGTHGSLRANVINGSNPL